jgi:mannan endo-1,4-beta-mannosidase
MRNPHCVTRNWKRLRITQYGLLILFSLGAASAGAQPVDAHATAETRALFANMRRLAGRQIMFGHQEDLAYGHDWAGEPGRSDVKAVTGAYPALYGWEFGGADLARLREWIVEGYERGGVITLSWHMPNPVTGGNAWDTAGRALPALLPGGASHATYVAWLDRFADFATSLRAPSPDGGSVLVPVIFRPFHEMSGGWFWWGATHASAADYQRLWRFTVEYLRDRRGVHNVLYAYSPDKVYDYGASHYLDWYPGDAYVDVLGVDQYWWPPSATWAPKDQVRALVESLHVVAGEADRRGKIAALTETGYETVPDSTWWTDKLLAALDADALTRRTAYVLVWRNANRAREGREHFYAPYPGQASAADFARFRAHPRIVFEDELPPMYRMP